MTIKLALQSETVYPIPESAIDKIMVDRGLVSDEVYTKTVSESKEFLLAVADVYYWLYTCQSFSEQEISFSIADRDAFLYKANKLYSQFDDVKKGNSYGFISENFNG